MSNAHLPLHDATASAAYDAAMAQGLSHDLRAPLRAIDGFATLLDQHLGERLDDTGRGYLQRIREAAGRMGDLVEALQELGAAGRATLKREPVDLGFLADWVAADLQALDPGRAAEVNVDLGLDVEGDEHYLRRMLWHLLGNAWKFSAPRERVRIDVTGMRRDDHLQLQVRDAGIGFDPQYAGKLFTPFQRLHVTEQGAGAGLGLAIAQCIARRHGGIIRAEAVTPQAGDGEAGSIFHIELPLTQPTSRPQEDAAHG